ncbi:MAG: bifunctional folylpolyglutamate synthase/dihydrofolate synthase [Christensenellales bacterium]
MKYSEAVQYIESLTCEPQNAMYFTGRLLEAMRSPQHSYRSVHIAGTNGKGSTCAMVESIVRAAGYKTGMFVSPHVNSPRERIRVDNQLISEQDFARTAEYVKTKAEENGIMGFGYFGFLAAMAYVYFNWNDIDLAVVEAGLGGRLDQTSVINPLVCVLTSISQDHTQYLGDSLSGIAREKCGIITDGCAVVSQGQQHEAAAAIDGLCKEKMRSLIFTSSMQITRKECATGELFDACLGASSCEDIYIPLFGQAQIENAKAAILTSIELGKNGFDLDIAHIKAGLANVQWPCRFERIAYDGICLILDGAHNVDAAKRLADTYSEREAQKAVLLCAVMKDKDAKGIIKALTPIAQRAVCTIADEQKGMKVKKLASLFEIKAAPLISPKAALEKAVRFAKDGSGIVLVAGSFYLCGIIKALIEETKQEETFA